MTVAATFIMTRLLFVLLVFCAIVVLQVFLSRMEPRWPGLILPGLWLLLSLVLLLNISTTEGAGMLALAIIVFLMGNIPTLILLAVYGICRHFRRRVASDGPDVEQELEQMKKKDLGD